jgi:DNA recombination protein RmuC
MIYIAFILGAAAIFFIHLLSSTKIRLGFALNDNIKLANLSDELAEEKIIHIKRIQELTSQIEYLTKANNDQERLRKEAFDSAKASLFDLGAGLSKQLLELHKQESKEVRDMSEKNIATTSEKFNAEFEKIVGMVGLLTRDLDQSKSTVDLIKKSLLSPSGAGKLAEITLENILKSSGLKASIDFNMQHSMSKEDGLLRPDAVIFLPHDNLMVIDAKASKFVVEMAEAESDGERKSLGAQLMKTMNTHLKSLVSKEYAENTIAHYHLKAQHFGNVMTLMFLPTEAALEQISALDPQFIYKAFQQNIFPVGPSGLMNMLSFARFQINDHQRSENHHMIIEEVRRLLGSVVTLAEHSQKLGNNIQSLANNYDKFSASFNRNFLPKARKVQNLGVDTGKDVIKPLERYHVISADVDMIEVEQSDGGLISEEKGDEGGQ